MRTARATPPSGRRCRRRCGRVQPKHSKIYRKSAHGRPEDDRPSQCDVPGALEHTYIENNTHNTHTHTHTHNTHNPTTHTTPGPRAERNRNSKGFRPTRHKPQAYSSRPGSRREFHHSEIEARQNRLRHLRLPWQVGMCKIGLSAHKRQSAESTKAADEQDFRTARSTEL